MMRIDRMLRILAPCLVALLLPTAAQAADDDAVPYWATVDTDLANLRVGPGETYKIEWVYRRRNLPVKVVRREGPWRLIVDPDGDKGWMRDLLLSRQRGAVVTGEGNAEMRAEGNAGANILWHLEPGVVGLLGDCKAGWCEFDVEGHKGFAPQDRLWGAGEP